MQVHCLSSELAREHGTNGFWNQGQAFPCATCCKTQQVINEESAALAQIIAERAAAAVDGCARSGHAAPPAPAPPAADGGVSVGVCILIAVAASAVSNAAMFLCLKSGKRELQPLDTRLTADSNTG